MTLRGILLLFIFLVGFYGFYRFFRVDEINSLILNDVAIRCNHMAIYVAKRKNDQYQELRLYSVAILLDQRGLLVRLP